MWSSGEARTGCDLCRSRPIPLHVKVRYVLPQQAFQKRLPQRVCCSSGCNARAQCCHIADDEAANEQIHEVEDQVVDTVLELLGVALANGIIVERARR